MHAEVTRPRPAWFVVGGRATTANTTAVDTASNITTWISSQSDDPLIAGTTIPIYRIAALLSGGMTVKEVAEDFPSLSEEQILGAQAHAARNPPPPYMRYPKQSIKRLLRNSGFIPVEEHGE